MEQICKNCNNFHPFKSTLNQRLRDRGECSFQEADVEDDEACNGFVSKEEPESIGSECPQCGGDHVYRSELGEK